MDCSKSGAAEAVDRLPTKDTLLGGACQRPWCAHHYQVGANKWQRFALVRN